MRNLKIVAVLAMFVVGAAALLGASPNNLGVADSYRITFDQPMHVAGNLLPAGDYTILHTMEGNTHIMTFRQEGKADVQIKVKCTLVPLAEKATQTQKIYVVNNDNQRELRELIFRGDRAKHVF